MISIFKRNISLIKWVFLLILLLLFIAIPICIQLHWGWVYDLAIYMTRGNHSDWLQFWGSYLGVIPSGLIAWLVTAKQIKSDRENSKIQHVESMYLDDLRQIKKILLVHHFSGSWQFPYNGPLIGTLTSPEIRMFRKTFLNISGEGDKEVIKTDSLFDVKTIVHGLPLSKRKCIVAIVDEMCDQILKIAAYKPSEFQEMEDQYIDTASHKNDDDFQMKKFEYAEQNWTDNSKLFWSHIENITEKFKELETFINVELSIYYKL